MAIVGDGWAINEKCIWGFRHSATCSLYFLYSYHCFEVTINWDNNDSFERIS